MAQLEQIMCGGRGGTIDFQMVYGNVILTGAAVRPARSHCRKGAR
jgi:hypothetical protein